MTKEELIKRLDKYPNDTEVMILDGFNGGGYPREINCGPREHLITENDAKETADCEDKVGKLVLAIGFGYY